MKRKATISHNDAMVRRLRKDPGFAAEFALRQLSRDLAAHVYAEEGIRQGLEDAKRGKIRPTKEFFEEFEAEHGIPR